MTAVAGHYVCQFQRAQYIQVRKAGFLGLSGRIIIMDWICMVLFKTLKAPDKVPGSIHSRTVILVVVNYDSS